MRPEDHGQMQLIERKEIDNEDELFEVIDKLIAQGINAGDVKKLQDAGIYTHNGLMMHTKKNLIGIKGLSEAKVNKICEAAEKIVNFGYITGSDALTKRKSIVKITTGSKALNELLGVIFDPKLFIMQIILTRKQKEMKDVVVHLCIAAKVFPVITRISSSDTSCFIILVSFF